MRAQRLQSFKARLGQIGAYGGQKGSECAEGFLVERFADEAEGEEVSEL